MKTTRRSAFTLVEVLIVVVIMAILAAAIIPQFSDSSNDAKLGTAEFNCHTIKSQLEMYKSQHDGSLPGSLLDLTKKTDVYGNVGTTPGTHIYGPYISELPKNPWNDKNTVVESDSQTAPSGFSTTDGWYFNTAEGNLWQAGKEAGGGDKLIGS